MALLSDGLLPGGSDGGAVVNESGTRADDSVVGVKLGDECGGAVGWLLADRVGGAGLTQSRAERVGLAGVHGGDAVFQGQVGGQGADRGQGLHLSRGKHRVGGGDGRVEHAGSCLARRGERRIG